MVPMTVKAVGGCDMCLSCVACAPCGGLLVIILIAGTASVVFGMK